MTLAPRPYQAEAVDVIVNYAARGPDGKMLVVCPPGGGKTLIGALAMRTLVVDVGRRGLAWAHRRELVGQMYDALVACGIPESALGVVMAGDPRHNPDAPIQVGSVDTIRHRDKPPADFIVSDEAHRDASNGRRKLRALYPNAFHLGLTATPVRLDGRGLGDEYDKMYVAAYPSHLIADGYIVAPKMYTAPESLLPDLRGVHKRCGDYKEDELEERSNRRTIVGGIVEKWGQRSSRHRTIVFPVTVRHSRAIVDQFRSAGVAAEHLDGSMPRGERERILKAVRAGSVRVVSSCNVLSEGVDIPAIKCVVQARATQSLTLHIQQLGRCMRPWGRVRPIVLDHAGNVRRLGEPYADHPWSLDYTRPRGVGASPMRGCSECGLLNPAGATGCEDCGAQLIAPRGEEPGEVDCDLVEFTKRFSPEEMKLETKRINAFAKKKGLPREWVKRVLVAKFGKGAAR
jgi:superfamily II DNA or RNA helicase